MPQLLVILAIVIVILTINYIIKKKYKELESKVLNELDISNWDIVSYYDENVTVKSRQTLKKYDDIKFFKENIDKLARAKSVIKRKNYISNVLTEFLNDNEYKKHPQYKRLLKQINIVIKNAKYYRIYVTYISSAGNYLGTKEISLSKTDIDRFDNDPSLLMSKGEYNRYLKEQEKEALYQKQHEYYEYVNNVVDYANENKHFLFTKGSLEQLDNLIIRLFDRTVNSIKKVKHVDSEEWDIINGFIGQIEKEIREIVNKNQRILKYYNSPDFHKIKETCEALMSTQREFNEYITEKVESISKLFGTRVARNETINEDEYQYIRPYKKTITPFTAEVSAAVFASAENNPIEYVIKYFYPNKSLYPEQILKLHILVEELATLKDAKQVIENYKKGGA